MRTTPFCQVFKCLLFSSVILLGSAQSLKADCTISGSVLSSSNPFTLPGCSSGVITITGTFTINTTNYNISGLTGITEIRVDGGTIAFSGLGLRVWRLPANTALTFVNGGSISTALPCNALKRIVIGSQIATCNGQFGLADFSFSDVNDAGGFASTGLPIELISFSGAVHASQIQLFWNTATEINNDFMAIERSGNELDFKEIGRVEGQGDTQTGHQYKWIDERPLSGINYYRLRQVDYDGHFEYHKTIALNFQGKDRGISISPSPAQQNLQVALSGKREQDSEVQLLNMQGQILLQMTLPAGKSDLELDISQLPSGCYTIHLLNNGRRDVARFMKT